MSDDPTEEDNEDGDSSEKKKRRIFSAGLFIKILIYIAVAVIFVILMVVVSVLVVRVINSGDRNNQLNQISTEFTVNNPIYTYYDQIESIRTRSADASPRSITAKVELGYDQSAYPNLSEELTQRKPQLTDLFRKYFSSNVAKELSSTNEDRVKEELKIMVNELLQNGKIDEVVFTDFQVLDF